MSTVMRKGIHVAGMDAVFKISQTTYRDRKIRAKNSLKEFFALISSCGIRFNAQRTGGNFIPHLML